MQVQLLRSFANRQAVVLHSDGMGLRPTLRPNLLAATTISPSFLKSGPHQRTPAVLKEAY